MEKVDVVIVGAGVIGLALARQFAQSGREVIVLESANAIGTETSARNSEVIHAGLYYPEGSLKAALCVGGRKLLYDYCAAKNIVTHRCGKLVVASTPEQIPHLQALYQQALRNDCQEVELLSPSQARALEPNLHCVAALHSPMTGILDSHAYLHNLLGDAHAAGALLALASPLHAGSCEADGVVLDIGGAEPAQLKATLLINAAGLWAPNLAHHIAGLDNNYIPPAYYAKGNYFSLRGKPPFTRLIYPIPTPGGLGIHMTLDLGGQARFGPDVEWTVPDQDGKLDYAVNQRRKSVFFEEIKRYWPMLEEDMLDPAYSGIRPKIAPAGTAAADFIFVGPRRSGSPHYLGLYGIESPGLTASLALADYVHSLSPP